MQKEIKTHKFGKLRIYLKTGEKVESEKLLRKMFPRSTYRNIVLEAKKDGIMNASVFQTHFGYSNNEKVHQHSFETDNSSLTVCIELIDEREKLEEFFRKHRKMLKDKVVIYKEVEFWDME